MVTSSFHLYFRSSRLAQVSFTVSNTKVGTLLTLSLGPEGCWGISWVSWRCEWGQLLCVKKTHQAQPGPQKSPTAQNVTQGSPRQFMLPPFFIFQASVIPRYARFLLTPKQSCKDLSTQNKFTRKVLILPLPLPKRQNHNFQTQTLRRTSRH